MGKAKTIQIQTDYCKGCGYCIKFCPKQVLAKSDEMTKKGFFPPCAKEIEKCTGCGTCENVCPDFAIYVEEMEDYR